MDDNTLDLLISGDLNKLPPLPKRVVRLFISSTFTDMTLERNSLMERVYPRLKKYCRERFGLDFQVVDMRWGVRDEATDDHQTVDLCSREIANCQRLSLGPNFIAFIGDKYGFRPLPNRIRSTEYRTLRRSLIELDINTDFLDTWYREDSNAVPAEYVLQPISSILKNFTNRNEPELQLVDQRIWQAIQERLHELLIIGSRRLVQQGRMNERDQLMKYSISVTEREVIEGCLDVNQAKLRCLLYTRSIVDLRANVVDCLQQLNSPEDVGSPKQLDTTSALHKSQLQQQNSRGERQEAHGKLEGRRESTMRKASLKIGDDTIRLTTSGAQTAAGRKVERVRRLIGRYIDLSVKDDQWQVDEEAQVALQELKENKLKAKLNPKGKNLTVFEIHWDSNEGMSLKSEEHKQYLNQLNEHFYANLTRMIRNAVKNEQSKVKSSGLIGEVLQHSHYARSISENVHRRGAELELIRSYILQHGKRREHHQQQQQVVLPMFVYGVGGSGKTSVLAKAATMAQDWIRRHSRRRSGAIQSNDNGGPQEKWNRKPCIIMRFCCTTPNSSTMTGVLTSVCRQLQFNFYQFGPLNGLAGQQMDEFSTSDKSAQINGPQATLAKAEQHQQVPYEPIPGDFVRLVFTFRRLLDNCQHQLHRRRLFVIILDSIERLSSQTDNNVEAKYSWLTSISSLPPNVRLIVSCGSEEPARNPDYVHLKRHFVQTYYEKTTAGLASNKRRGSGPQEDIRYLPSRTESSLTSSLSVPSSDADIRDRRGLLFAGSGGYNAEAISGLGYDRYRMLRRLIIPAVRLIRGSRGDIHEDLVTGRRSVTFDESPSSGRWSYASARISMSPSNSATLPNGNQNLHCDQEDNPASVWTTNNGHQTAWLLHIRPLGPEAARSILGRWLSNLGRQLTRQQWCIVERSFAHCSRPIFVKLALGEVASWKSYSAQGDTRGLTFGSTWLAESSPVSLLEDDELVDDATDPTVALARLVRKRQQEALTDEDNDTFRWHLLSMEQQWLNYLDYTQRVVEQSRSREQSRLQNNNNNNQNKSNGDNSKSVVIQIGASKGGISRLVGSKRDSVGGGGTSGLSTTGGSATSTVLCHLSDTIEDAICQLFARIELQHGYLLTKHSLSYITVARNGIGENELEDILSLDDVVLDDVFQYHLPPVRRIPPLLWTRIHNDLPDYLSERDADGIVLAWHYEHFKAVTLKRYLADRRQLTYIHSTMADYFLGKWADKAKPFRCTKQQIQLAAEQLESAIQSSIRDSQSQPRSSLTGVGRLGSGSGGARTGGSFSVRNRLRSSDQHDARFQWMQAKADRRVPHQPLYYLTSDGANSAHDYSNIATNQRDSTTFKTSSSSDRLQAIQTDDSVRRYNLRKLTELPHHLMRSGRFIELASCVLFNYKWLFAALNALGLHSLFKDFNEALDCLQVALIERRKLETESNCKEQEQQVFSALNEQVAGQSQDEFLDSHALQSIIGQLSTLRSTLRLSSSVIHSETQMLGPQLIGRLLPVVKQQTRIDSLQTSPVVGKSSPQTSYLSQLLEQCDQHGCLDCALLPIEHCLQSADGLQLSSLEGHSFAVMSMVVLADQRHLLAASNKLIMWDISTGEIARDIDVKLEGSMIRQLEMGKTNQFAICYTSSNIVLALDILTQEVARYQVRDCCPPPGAQEHGRQQVGDSSILGLRLIDVVKGNRFLVWTSSCWTVLSLEYNELKKWSSSDTSLEQQEANQQGMSIKMDYTMDAADEIDFVGRLLDVRMIQMGANELSDLVFVVFQHKQTNEMQLMTIEVISGNRKGNHESLFIWSARIGFSCMALSSTNEQLVFSDSEGDIYLSRRRRTCWSKPKLLRPKTEDTQQNSSGLAFDANSRGKSSLPLAIDVDSQSSVDSGECNQHEPMEYNDHSDRFELAKFEQKLDRFASDYHRSSDQDEQDDQIVEEAGEVSVFKFAAKGQQSFSQTNKRNVMLRKQKNSVCFVKLYLQETIVVLQLDQQLETNPNKPMYKEWCLILPRNIRNVSVGPNKSQFSSLIMRANYKREEQQQQHHLVVSATKTILVYWLEGQQLLRSIEAHGGRITELRPVSLVSATTTTNNRQPTDEIDTNGSRINCSPSCIASASMDRTVKIWNLANIDKESQSMDKLDKPIELMSLARKQQQQQQQRPLVVCLARGELAIWNWATLQISCRLSASDLYADFSDRETTDKGASIDRQDVGEPRLVACVTYCKLSPSGRYLFVATSKALSLLSIDNWKDARSSSTSRTGSLRSSPESPSNLAIQGVQTRRVFACPLPVGCKLVRKAKFIAQDSRLLVTMEAQTNANSFIGMEQSENEDQTEQRPRKDLAATIGRLVVVSYSIPDGRRLFTIDYLTPAIQSSRDSHYLPVAGSRHLGPQNKSNNNNSNNSRDKKLTLHNIRLPVVSQDQRSVICAELVFAKQDRVTGGSETKDETRRRSSDWNKQQQIVLSIHSARDGQLVRTVDLTKLLVVEQPNGGQSLQESKPQSNRPKSSNQVKARTLSTSHVSISADQFTRLKSIKYLDRQTIVALIDDVSGSAYLVDTSGGQLVACLSSWNGQLSSDGRYGLTRMLKSSSGSSLSTKASGSSSSGNLFSSGGLQLLEMRRCRPVKTLLSMEMLARIAKSEHQSIGGGGGADRKDIQCGFTRPNDAYVYYHDLRLKRLLLIRVRDSQLIANYKQSVAITTLKCSNDGLALVLGLADGSVTSLAIVDPQSSDTQTKLAQYPSRKRT